MSQELILVINPGSTSTKVAVYKGLTPLFVESIKHTDEELSRFPDINTQKDFRENLIREFLQKKGVDPAELRAVAARGGLLKPLASGTYVVNQEMVDDLAAARQGSHASNLAAQIGYSLAAKLGITCYIVDPVSVDEAEPLARYSGHPLFHRVMLTHALNMKAVAKRFCREKGLTYQQVTLLVIHLGTGNSLSLHKNGRMIDAVNPSEEGAFSADRSGGLPILQLARHICDQNLKYKEFEKMVFGSSGLFAYLGSKDFLKIKDKYLEGEGRTVEVVQAMAYQVAKETGALATVVDGRVDAILITGGIAFNEFFSELIRKRVQFIAPVHVYAGEDEMQALAEGVARVMSGEEAAKNY
ncbi:MAG: butyrate kinase [Acidobacteria bacterium]|nr:butyrate kinase [Acidobacteriota bacterium]MBU4306780.1 butyrate kinase [Acidobacteriota bacterium]MBU4405212.1 butyrate kinase [Acidobacteriota bacterium]MCG2812151.1 butyrate kinase [Candidatus Aminicenantes bacterium]